MISGYEFWDGPWHDVETLLAEINTFYAEHVTTKGLGDRFTITAKRIMEMRKWEPSRVLIEKNMDEVLRDMNLAYIPKQIQVGPALLFPQQNLYGHWVYGKMRPLYELVLKAGPAKYVFLGRKQSVIGPMWFGNTDHTLANIGRTRKVLLVEGPFDLLACRLLFPDLPVLSSGTKSIADEHIQYLQMLGVEDVYLMFDNEDAKGDREMGAGNQAARMIAAIYSKRTSLRFHPMACPNNDPSMCLENYNSAMLLKRMIQRQMAA